MIATFIQTIAVVIAASAAASTPTNNLIVDQLGWRASAPQKMAVIANPQSGQNAPHAIAPGANFEIRRSSDNATMYTGALSIWNGGATDASSGDKAWWADFSSFNTPGTYYVYNAPSAQSSYPFQINDNVYQAPLDAVVKFYFYQRCGGNISAANGGNWNHAACHLGANQDLTAQLWYNGAAHGLPKNVSGGWHDAGDYGKYVEFVPTSVWNLLYAYEHYPSRFGDSTNIPESGNGVPDILDETKWELDWLLKMQNADGSVASKIGIAAYESQSPPDAIPGSTQRYYTLSSTAAASTMAALCAYGARVFSAYGAQYPGYSAQLLTASQNAWTWLQAHPSQILSDNTGLVNASTDVTASEDAARRVWAAAELYASSGTAAYKTYFDANYTVPFGAQNPVSGNNFVPADNWTLEAGMVSYASAAGATAGVVTAIKTALKNGMTNQVMPNDLSDPYRAFVWDWHYYWGSNQQKGAWGEFCLWAVNLNVNAAQNTAYLTKAEEYIHYFHGRNPLSWVYITGMQAFGASKVVGEIYHGWFKDGSLLYDGNPPLSTYGPAPGIMPGGVNRATTGGITPPTGEPYQKAYKDWNTGWPENSWEVTEPDQGYTGPYLVLCAAFAPAAGTPTPTPTFTIYAGTPTYTATPTPSPSASASPTPVCQSLLNGAETLAENGTWSGTSATRSIVAAGGAPAGAVTQGSNCLSVNVTATAGWSDNLFNLGGFAPAVWTPYSTLQLDINVAASFVAGATYHELRLMGDCASCGAGIYYQPIASNIPVVVAGQQTLSWTIDFTAGTIPPGSALSKITLIYNNNATSATGNLYVDNIRLLGPCVATATVTPTRSYSMTHTPTLTASQTPSKTNTPTLTTSPSITVTASSSLTFTISPSISPTPTDVPPGSSPTDSPSPTASFSLTCSATPTSVDTATDSPTETSGPSATPTTTLAANTPTPSPSLTRTPVSSATPSVTRTPLAVNSCPRVSMMFFPDWLSSSYPSSSIPYGKLTHIAYAFAGIQASGNLSMPNPDPTLISMAHAAGVKVLLSVGGAGSDVQYQPMIASAVARTAFINSVEANLRSAGFDGVDIDYEFPKNATDRSNLNLTIQGLRTKFASSAAPAPAWLITGDLSQDQYYGQWWDVATLKNYMNYFNIMVYDMYGSWNNKAGLNAPLQDSPLPGGDSNYSGAYSVYQYSTVRGLPASQMLYGLPFYGYYYSGIENIYDSCGGPCPGVNTPYKSIAPLVGAGWTRSYDATAESPYLRNNSGPGLYAYDDVQSISAKASWAVAQGLAGVFAWEISNDRMADGSEPLLDAAWSAVQCVLPTFTITPTFSATPTAPGTFTITPTMTATPSFSMTATPFQNGPLVVERVLPVPNPNPVALSFYIQGPADELQLRVYGPGYMVESKVMSGPCALGWNSLALSPEFLRNASNGVYYYTLIAKRGAVKSETSKGKFYILK